MTPPGVVLASASPRRRTLLDRAGLLDLVVQPAHVDETPGGAESPVALVRRLARAKRDAVRPTVEGGAVVVAADTVVEVAGTVLAKPDGEEDAARMLAGLAGRVATVWSGVATAHGDEERGVVVGTMLRMRQLTGAAIDEYVRSGEPLGVAGAFRIQGRGAALVAARHGCWTNVVGLPLCELSRLLRPSGVVVAGDECAPGVTPSPLA